MSESAPCDSAPQPKLSLAEATALAQRAVDEAGGASTIYRNPRHPYAIQQSLVFSYDGHEVEVRPGEISSPAIVSVEDYYFLIEDEGIELLMSPCRCQE